MNVRNKYRTVILEVGDSESATELENDVRHWIEHAESNVQICLIVKLDKNLNRITLLIWRRQDPTGPNLRSRPRHTTAILTDSVTIARGARNYTVQFTNPLSLPLAPTTIVIPISAFTGSPLTTANLIITQQDLLELGRRFWIPAFQLE